MRTKIVVKTQFEGIHCWADCHIDRVKFLASPHRHVFYVTIKLSVTDDNRELEFFIEKSRIDAIIKMLYPIEPVDSLGLADLGSRSCEMIAKEIMNKYLEFMTHTSYMFCSVFEDNENGAEVEWHENYEDNIR